MHDIKPVVGIGACLTGLPVRYNGDSKRKNPHIEILGKHMRFKSFCPEVAIGMGVPRETVRLVGEQDAVRLMDSSTQRTDYTDPMQAYATTVASNNTDMAGYILVKGSPSCGYQRVKRYTEKGEPAASDAMGIFAARLEKNDPLLPLEEDGRLNDAILRENFIMRVYTYHQWKQLQQLQQLQEKELKPRDLIEFWTNHKYLVMAHCQSSYRSIGRLLSDASADTTELIGKEFIGLLMNALKKPASRSSHVNVLEHIRGYLKKQLSTADKQEISDVITQYRQGSVPLIVPLTLLKHHFRLNRHGYINKQVFMSPYPDQLGLRNHI